LPVTGLDTSWFVGGRIMKILVSMLLAGGTLLLFGCIQSSKTEQRVVELPAGDPNSTLETAASIGRGLQSAGLVADVKKQFPDLTQKELSGVYLTWNVGNFKGKKSVFFLTGIQYSGSLPDAKAVADYCELRVKEAVAEKLPQVDAK